MRPKSSSSSRSESCPVRIFQRLTLASAQMRRSTNCSLLISREKIPTLARFFMAVCLAKSMASDVFPTLGRDARITKSDFCKPERSLSKSMKPVGRPRKRPLCLCNSSIRLKASGSRLLIGWKDCLRY